MSIVLEVARNSTANTHRKSASEVIEGTVDNNQLRAQLAELAWHRASEFVQVNREPLQMTGCQA